MEKILKQAKEEYQWGSYFYSTTGKIKSPIRVTELKISDNYPNMIVEIEGGVVYDNGVWAKKYKK
jgi:hypothetical protein